MKGYPNFVGQSDLPKCPFENFEIEILQYGVMAFVREFLGDFVLIDAGLLAPSLKANYRLKYNRFTEKNKINRSQLTSHTHTFEKNIELSFKNLKVFKN